MTFETQQWTLNSLFLSDAELREARQRVYHSTGPGYFIIRHFLDAQQVAHLQDIWTAPWAARHFQPFVGKHQFRFGCSNFYKKDDRGNRTFFNFVWARPLDELTYEVTFFIQQLRNRVSGRNTSNDILPLTGNSVSYRVVHTRNHEAPVPPHRDFWEPDKPLSKMHDLTRVQATLVLSMHGKDYDGEGFTLVNNQGKKTVFGVDEPVEAGDLVIWKYSNIHSVMNVRSREDQLGFLRILYPQENILSSSLRSRVVQTLKASRNRGFLTSRIPVEWKMRIKRLVGAST